MNEEYRILREENRRNAELQAQIQAHQQTTDAVAKLEDRMGTALTAFLKYLDGKTTKTEVVNQLKEIGTPDAFKVMSAVNDMHASLKKLKNTDLSEVTSLLRGAVEQLTQLPKELPEFEQKESVTVTNLPDFEALVDKLEDAIEKIDVKPVVNVPETKINVEAPIVNVEQDFATLQKSLKDVSKAIVSAVENIVFPETKVDFTGVEEKIEKSNKLLQKIVDKPTGGGGSGGHTTPYQDNDGKPTYITLVDGKIPVSLTSGSDPSSFYVYDIEEGTTSYYGNTSVAGAWMLKKVTDTLVSYATVTNNGSVTTYTDAWTDRAVLTYGRIDEAF